MKTIQLTHGKVALIDDADYDLVSSFTWRALKSRHGNWYACRSTRTAGKRGCVYMHRLLVAGEQVDHKNGNGLDNRRDNLRPARHQQNQFNQRRSTANTSGFKGVHKSWKSWAAAIKVNQKKVHLGTFSTRVDAAHAYDAAAIKHFGEFANLNFP